jgi:hypothetical protein
MFDFPLFYGHILQVQNPHRPSHQIHSPPGAIEEGEPGSVPQDGEWNAGQPHPRPNIQHSVRDGIKSGGEQDRIPKMPIVESSELSGSQTPGDDRLLGQPSLIVIETIEGGGIHLDTDPLRTPQPDLMMFHVKPTLRPDETLGRITNNWPRRGRELIKTGSVHSSSEGSAVSSTASSSSLSVSTRVNTT